MAQQFNIADMYIPLERGKPDEENERAFEHNKIVHSFDNPEGQAQAREAHQYWSEEFLRVNNGHAQRMLQISKGLAGIEEPWFSDVGRLTPDDRKELMAFAKMSEAAPTKDPDLDTILKNLDARQIKEAITLTDRQESQFPGDPTQRQRDLEERVEQQKDFAAERERYVNEYQESQRMLEEMREAEKNQKLEHGEEQEKGFSR